MIRKIGGSLGDGLLKTQQRLIPITTYMPRFNRAKKLIDHQAKHTLDASCGTGEFTIWLAKRGLPISGVNISPHEIEIARQNAHKAMLQMDLQVGDLSQQTPFPDGSFDQIISLDTVVHIQNTKAAFEEFHRLLAPGGRLLVSLASFAPSGRGQLFWGENALRKNVPHACHTPPIWAGKSWLTLTPQEQQARFYQHKFYAPDEVKKETATLFHIEHIEYTLHLFGTLTTDLVFGVRFARYLEPLLFSLGTQLDQWIFPRKRPGYLLFAVLRKPV